MIVPRLGFFTAVFPWPRRLHAYIVGSCSIIVSGGIFWHTGQFPSMIIMCFDPALGGWGDWCRRSLHCLHQSAPYFDMSVGEVFFMASYVNFGLVSPSHVAASSNHAVFTPLLRSDPVRGQF